MEVNYSLLDLHSLKKSKETKSRFAQFHLEHVDCIVSPVCFGAEVLRTVK